MPPLAKRACQAKCQRASRGKVFDMGLVEELLDSNNNPTYSAGSPTDNLEADPDEEFSQAFSFLDDKIELAPDGNYELEQMNKIIGEK